MNKFFSLCLCLLMLEVYGNDEIYEETGIFYKTNRFGDIFPLWQEIPEKELSEKLLAFVEAFKEKGSPIIIEIPHEKSPLLNAILKSNFTFHYADQNHSEWIIKNHSPIPHPLTAIGGTQIMVMHNGNVLVVEERTRKGILGLPAGGADPGEFVRDTACRELYEEVGLIAQPQDLKLIALINRKNANKQAATLYNHCFIVEEVDGSLTIDSKEIVQAFWVPLKELAEASEIKNLKVSTYINALAKHVLSECSSSFALKLPDNRQILIPFDPNDTMHVEFFHQKLKGK